MVVDIQLAQKHLSKTCRTMAQLLKRHGQIDLPNPTDNPPYRILCRSIAHQQLHGKAAETILARFIALFPGKDFPTPEEILAIDAALIRGCGFSEAKVKSLRDIAEKTIAGVVPSLAEAQKLSNDELIIRLTEIRGVGRWTVEMLLIFQLGRMDVLPVDDFGVRNGYRLAYKKRKMPTAKQLAAYGKRWQPYGSLAALYLWHVADLDKVERAASAKKKPKGKKPKTKKSKTIKKKVAKKRGRKK